MNRRKFIKKAAIGVPVALSAPYLFSGCRKDPIDTRPEEEIPRIIVIGAGISGLAAAKNLKDRGLDVTILEAGSEIGGRTRTDHSQAVPFDLGASWIHGAGGNPIPGLANKSGVTTFTTHDDIISVFDSDGSQYSETTLDDAYTQYQMALANIETNGSLDKSFEEVYLENYAQYENDRLWKYQMSAFLEFDTGADIAELSSQDFNDDSEFFGNQQIVTNGYDKIPEYLSEAIDIRLNTRVSSIDYNKRKITVNAEGRTYQADYVIVAVPLGVLKENKIIFNPSLPATKRNAIVNMKMGVVNKFMCFFDTAFWDTDLHYIGYTPDTMGKFNYFVNVQKYSGVNALMTFAFGDYAVQTESMDDTTIQTEIMDHLRAIYGSSIPNPTKILRTSWASDENAYGSYSYVPKGARSTEYEELARQLEDKVFFCGEHTSKDYRGTAHGAYLSGIDAAKEIATVLEI